MPKKLPLYWPDDATCNKLNSKTLRVLRDRPNKLNSGPRTIQNLCNSYKATHFKPDKQSKFRPIEDFHGFLSSETVLSRHTKKRQRPRQVLHSNESQKPEYFQNLNSNSSWKKKYSSAMAVDFDHMYIDCGDSKISIGRDIEFQHLKELNLINLDLIQQQAEQLISKDKIIKSLKEENKNLRARLERIDRRVSLSLQKKPNALSPISVQTDFSNDVSFPFCVKPEGSPRSPSHHRSPARSPTIKNLYDKPSQIKVREDALIQTEGQISKRDSLRRLSPRQTLPNSSISPASPISPVHRVSPREKRAKKDSTPNLTEVPLSPDNHQLPSSLSPSSCDSHRKTRSPSNKRTSTEEPFVPQKKSKGLEYELEEKDELGLGSDQEEGITNHSLRSRNKSQDSRDEALQDPTPLPLDSSFSIPVEPLFQEQGSEKPGSNIPLITSSSIDPESWKNIFKADVETRKIRGEGVLTTTESYYLPSHSIDFLSDSGDEQTQVELPKWRIKVMTSLYVMEGTENLEDEIFLKRHAKPEQDERRRKRWDLQRMREQRQYEKLLERYKGRNDTDGSDGGNMQSLWPQPESALCLQVDNYLPVCAFGQPLVQISERDFFVPWLTGKAPLQVRLSTRRKKR